MMLGGMLLCAPISLTAQVTDSSSTFHVFPQVVDGWLSNDVSYRSTLMIANQWSASATCTLQLYGMRATFSGSVIAGTQQDSFRFTLAGHACDVAITSVEPGFASGYATLSCDRPVTAQILYSLYTDSVKRSEATVFSSLPGKMVQVIADHRENSRLGLAVANDTDRPVTYRISATDRPGNAIKSDTISIASRSKKSAFVEELIPGLPTDYIGPITISSNDYSTVYAVGLNFSGTAFTTIPATLAFPTQPTELTAGMLNNIQREIDYFVAENQGLLDRNPNHRSLIEAKIGMLQSPSLASDIINSQFYSEGGAISTDGRAIPISAIFPRSNMRSEASEAVTSVELALPILEEFLGTFPSGEVRIYYGFKLGNTGGVGSINTEDRSCYEARTIASTALPYEQILDHELAHSYIGHESLTQFLELYIYNMVHAQSTNLQSWTSTRNYVPSSATNTGVAALLDVYQLVGWNIMSAAYRKIYALHPPYGQVLSSEAKQVFIDQAPEAVKAQVAEKMTQVTY